MTNEHNNLVIRVARDTDRAAIAALQADSWRSAYRNILPSEYLGEPVGLELANHWAGLEITSNDVVMVAEFNDEIVGFISIWCRPEPYIDNFHTKPEFKHRGIGSNLLVRAAEQLLQLGQKTAHLWVIQTNLPAKKFYERMGGKVTESADRAMFDHVVASYKIEWPDLAALPAPVEFR
ncbi:MAG: GNAT family N-acetyltransferase [Stappiaceae bacterium]